MKNHLNTSNSFRRAKDTQIKPFLEATRHLKPIGKQVLQTIAYRFGVSPEQLYVLLNEVGGLSYG